MDNETIDRLCFHFENGGDVNATDDDGNTALHHAARNGVMKLIALLMSKVPDIDVKNTAGETALFLAARENFPHIVELLVAHKASANVIVDGVVPLNYACHHGSLDMVKTLCPITVKPSANALCLATSGGHVDVMRYLLGGFIAVDATTDEGDTALHQACQKLAPEPVDILLAMKARIDISRPNGILPIDVAVEVGNEYAVRLLLLHGANADVRVNGYTQLQRACWFGHEKVIELLLQNNADVNETAAQKITALHIAVVKGTCGAVKLLLDAGANANAQDLNMWTPLHNAALGNKNHMVRLLIEGRADPNLANSDGKLPHQLSSCGEIATMCGFRPSDLRYENKIHFLP